MTPTYSTLFNKSWDSLKNNLPLVAGLTLVYMVGLGAMSCLPVFGGFFTAPFTAGYMICLLRIRKNEVFGYTDVFWGFMNFSRFLQLLLASFLVGVITIAGTICLLIPGIWFAIASSFTTSYIVLNDTDAITAIKKSLAAVKGRWWFVFGLLLFCGLLAVLGALCFVIGLLLALPVSSMMILIAAEQLSTAPQNTEGPTVSSGPSVLNVNPS